MKWEAKIHMKPFPPCREIRERKYSRERNSEKKEKGESEKNQRKKLKIGIFLNLFSL